MSSFGYKCSPVELWRLRSTFAVNAVVCGRVAFRNGHVVVGAELIDAATEAQVWGARFRRRASGLCAVQREIARGIFRELRARLEA